MSFLLCLAFLSRYLVVDTSSALRTDLYRLSRYEFDYSVRGSSSAQPPQPAPPPLGVGSQQRSRSHIIPVQGEGETRKPHACVSVLVLHMPP